MSQIVEPTLPAGVRPEGSDLRQSPFRTVAMTALLVALALLVEAPYFPLGFIGDDLDHLQLLARLQLGEVSLAHYLFKRHNEHVFPLWRMWYLTMWSAAGLGQAAWHVSVALAQAGGAAALWRMFLRAGVGPAAAFTGAALWAMFSVGSWDNPRLWIGATHLSLGVNLLLVATALAVCGRQWVSRLGMSLFLVASLLTMSVLVVLAPMVLLLRWAIRWQRGETESRSSAWAWVICWMVSVLVLPGVIVLTREPQTSAPAGQIAISFQVPIHAALMHISAAGRMIGVTIGSQHRVIASVIAASGVAVLLGLAARTHWRWLVVLGATTFAYASGIAAARSWTYTLPDMLEAGRYGYVPALLVVALLTLGLDLLYTRVHWFQSKPEPSASTTALPPTRNLGPWAVTGVLGVLFFWAQIFQAQNAADQWMEVHRPTMQLIAENQRLMHELASQSTGSSGRDRVIGVPNLLVINPPTVFTLREMRVIMQLPASSLPIVSAEQLAESDFERLRPWLANHARQGAFAAQPILWLQQLELARELRGLLLGCARCAANSSDPPIALPEIIVGRLPLQDRLSRWNSSLFFPGLDQVRIVPATDLSATDRQRLHQLIADIEPQITGPAGREILKHWRSAALAGGSPSSMAP